MIKICQNTYLTQMYELFDYFVTFLKSNTKSHKYLIIIFEEYFY